MQKTPKPFRLSEKAIQIIESRSRELGTTQTAIVELALLEFELVLVTAPQERVSSALPVRAETAPVRLTEPEAVAVARETVQKPEKPKPAQVPESKPVKYCEHGAAPTFCKHSKCPHGDR